MLEREGGVLNRQGGGGDHRVGDGGKKREKKEEKEFARRTSQAIHPAPAAWHSTGSATSVAQSWEARWRVCSLCVFVYLCAEVCVYVRLCVRTTEVVRWNRDGTGLFPAEGLIHTSLTHTHTHTPAKLLHRPHRRLLWQTTQFQLTLKVHFT